MTSPVQRLIVGIAVASLCYGAVLAWMQDTDRRHELPQALCPNFDSLRVVRHHWIPERSRVIRTIPAPPCEVAP